MIQTILGANGQIGEELASALHSNYTDKIRLVSRKPKRIHDTDELFAADLNDAKAASEAVKGSSIAYFTLGLPMNTDLWEQQFPKITRNVIEACKEHGTKLVFFDNTYMYPQDGRVLTEETVFAPNGRKGKVRQEMAEMVLNEIAAGTLDAVICRAPEFYGPQKTQSITNSLLFDKVMAGEKLQVPLRDDTKRSLIWTPDASRATALIGNTPEAYGQTWHLPIDASRPTYKNLIQKLSEAYQTNFSYSVIGKFKFWVGSLFKKSVRELQELLPRYATDNIFSDDKFRKAFPDFQTTSFGEGIEIIKQEQEKAKLKS